MVRALVVQGLADSCSVARRLISQSAVTLDGRQILDISETFKKADQITAGKKVVNMRACEDRFKNYGLAERILAGEAPSKVLDSLREAGIGREIPLTAEEQRTISSGRVTFYSRREGHDLAIDISKSTSKSVIGICVQNGIEYVVSRPLLKKKIVWD